MTETNALGLPQGPLYLMTEIVRQRERQLTALLAPLELGLHEWRALRLPIQGLAWHYPEPDVLQLEFVLPAGCFATVVVREILDLVPTGQTENPCAY